MLTTKPMSNIQLELLKLYANDVPDEQLQEIKLLLGRYFAEKATSLMDDFMVKEGLTADDMIKWAQEHDRDENRS